MEKGSIYEVEIEDMSSEGSGIGRAEGMVVFIPGTVPGDIVRTEITGVKKRYSFGRVIEITAPSHYRNDGFECSALKKGCGGCRYSQVSYEKQLDLKEKKVRENIRRIAGLDAPDVKKIIGMKEDDNEGLGHLRYRNKAQFIVSTGGIITKKGGRIEAAGEVSVGFYRAKSHTPADCEDCALQSEAAVAAADALRRFMKEDHITAWDEKWRKGLMRHMIVRTAFSTGEVMVILVINGKGIPNMNKLVEMLDDAIYESGYSLESVILSIKKEAGRDAKGKNQISRGRGGDVLGEENIAAAGKPVIEDRIGNLKFEISPQSFYQVNPVQTERLYDKVREYCTAAYEKDRSPVILDLYCGVGSIGLYCADIAEYVIGIESVKAAVLDANRNAVINGIVNARYICGYAEEILPLYAQGGNEEGNYGLDDDLKGIIAKADIVILDPPRAGCRKELLEAVINIAPERIVYVSCDPATMARDIKILCEEGYDFIEATPVDMFPNTDSVEMVVLLSKTKIR